MILKTTLDSDSDEAQASCKVRSGVGRSMVSGIHLSWELRPSAVGRETGREEDRLLHWLQHKTRAGRRGRTHVLCCSPWPSQQVTFSSGWQQLIHCEEEDTEEGNEGEREGAEREIKSITIDSCVRDRGSRRGKTRGEKSDREWWDQKTRKRAWRKMNERGNRMKEILMGSE